MRAVTIVDGVLVWNEHPDPAPGPGEVLVAVTSAGINGADLLQRQGFYPAPPGWPVDIPGMEFSGLVRALGPGTTRYAVGDRVMAICGGGGQAEQVVVPESALLPVPEGIDLVHAGGFPEVFTTAQDALFTQARLGGGDRVLISGAAGGVGTAAVQLARDAGAHVVATVRNEALHGQVRALGADEVVLPDQVADLARTHRPKLIVAGSTAYARIIDPMPFREIADSVGAKFLFDAAHPAGLIAGGVHPSPVGVADVVTFTTHKTLRGPRGGAILCSAEYAKAIDSAIFPGLQGGPLENVIAGKAVAFAEAARPEFRDYSAKVVTNAQALATAVGAEGIRLVSGGTENHQVLCDLRSFDAELTGKEAQEVLDRAGITCNRNTIPDDPRSPFVTSGLRLGTAALTTTGMGEAEMARVGALIGRTLRGRADDGVVATIRQEVRELCAGFPPYPGLAGA